MQIVVNNYIFPFLLKVTLVQEKICEATSQWIKLTNAILDIHISSTMNVSSVMLDDKILKIQNRIQTLKS